MKMRRSADDRAVERVSECIVQRVIRGRQPVLARNTVAETVIDFAQADVSAAGLLKTAHVPLADRTSADNQDASS